MQYMILFARDLGLADQQGEEVSHAPIDIPPPMGLPPPLDIPPMLPGNKDTIQEEEKVQMDGDEHQTVEKTEKSSEQNSVETSPAHEDATQKNIEETTEKGILRKIRNSLKSVFLAQVFDFTNKNFGKLLGNGKG